jgi:2,4-dienoyl-CoA reductase (NADPH2)
MEAARVAALRGHEVILYEKESRLGGLLRWVALIKGPDVDCDAMILMDFFKNQITKLSVTIRIGEEWSLSALDKIHPDAVILATGGIPEVPVIRGIENSNVFRSDDLYRRLKEDLDLIEPGIMRGMNAYWEFIGNHVAIIGGAVEGSSLAEFFVERCRRVTLVEEGLIWGDVPMLRSPSMEKVIRMPEVHYEEITDKGLIVTSKEGRRQVVEADTFIVTTNSGPDYGLLKNLDGKAPEIYLVGAGNREPNTIMNAIGNGYRIAKAV